MAIGKPISAGPIYDTATLTSAEYNVSVEKRDTTLTLKPLGVLAAGSDVWPQKLPLDANYRVEGGFETSHNLLKQSPGGGRVKSFYDLFYERIHYDPAVLRMGQLLNEQTRQLWVWNSYFEPRTLLSVMEIDNEGVDLATGPLPQSFLPLQQKVFNVSVTVDGPPSINASFVFEWDNQTFTWRVDGERLVVFAYEPTLGTAFVERYTWYSSISTAYSGREQRMALNDDPKISYTYRVQVLDKELQLFNAAMWGWQNRVFAVPVWDSYAYTTEYASGGADRLYLQNPVSRGFLPNTLAVVYAGASMYEAVEILEVTDEYIDLKKPLQRSWTKRVKVLPVRNMRLNREIGYSSPVVNFREVDIGFISESGEQVPAIPWTDFYKGRPVLGMWPDVSGPVTGSYTRNMDWDEGEYSMPLVVDKSGVQTPKQTWQYTWDDKQEALKFKSLLQTLRGTVGDFWAYTWTPDLTLAEVIEPGSSFILVEEAMQVNMYFDRRGRSDIVLILRDGTHLRRSIYNVSTGSSIAPGTEMFMLEDPIDRRIRPVDVYMICYMTISRFENEAFEFNWKTENWASLSVMVKGQTDGI